MSPGQFGGGTKQYPLPSNMNPTKQEKQPERRATPRVGVVQSVAGGQIAVPTTSTGRS